MIVVDSCVDFNDKVLKNQEEIQRIPFKITIDDEEFIDKNLDTTLLLSKMKMSSNKILTSCPSPYDFLEAFQKGADNFVVTISSKLSGSYNSAMMAKKILAETDTKSFIHIFDSRTASAGQSLIVLKIKELLDEKLSSLQIIGKTNEYISQLKTLFILNSLDNLVKNGRISSGKALIGNLLHIIPIMGENGQGEIVLKDKVRGEKKAFARLINMIGESKVDFQNTVLAITHTNAKEKAEQIKETIKNLYPFKDVIIFEASGLSTVYIDDGGIVLAY